MRRVVTFGLIAVAGALILSACAVSAGTSTSSPTTATPLPTDTPEAPTPTATPAPEATATLLPGEKPPLGAEFEFSTDFSKHSVPFSEIQTLLAKDSIRALDEPKLIGVEEADEWLEPQEPVIVAQVGEEARAYPVQILILHEIVNDRIGAVPVAVTFCPLCNTGIAFERTFDGRMLDFGTTGRLRFSNLVMYDRQTETWWQQATGEGIAGEYTGRQLTFVPASLISWADFKAAHRRERCFRGRPASTFRTGEIPTRATTT